MDAYRTPEDRFSDLPDFDHEPRYREVDGLRLAHLDAGDGAPVVFVHGEPTWSFLWRKVIGPVRDAGYRCIAPDHAGFGRSDKPTDIGWYSYDRHSELFATCSTSSSSRAPPSSSTTGAVRSACGPRSSTRTGSRGW